MRSADRILTTHAGSLPRPALIRELLTGRKDGKIVDPARLDAELPAAVRDVVAKQIEVGLDSVDDGEFGKVNFTDLFDGSRHAVSKFGRPTPIRISTGST